MAPNAGAVHAATPGHGKTIAAAYIVGARGKPIDALILGVFVTLSHTSGIVVVGALASLGEAWLMPQKVEAWLALAMGLLVVGLGAWMLWMQRDLLALALGAPAGGAQGYALAPAHADAHGYAAADHAHDGAHVHAGAAHHGRHHHHDHDDHVHHDGDHHHGDDHDHQYACHARRVPRDAGADRPCGGAHGGLPRPVGSEPRRPLRHAVVAPNTSHR